MLDVTLDVYCAKAKRWLPWDLGPSFWGHLHNDADELHCGACLCSWLSQPLESSKVGKLCSLGVGSSNNHKYIFKTLNLLQVSSFFTDLHSQPFPCLNPEMLLPLQPSPRVPS